MNDHLDLWRRIDAALDDDESIDEIEFLGRLGIEATPVAERLGDAVADLVGQAFNDEDLTAEIGGSRYRVLRRINTGGQSDVYLAERADGVYTKTVVIKRLAGHYDNDLLREQFMREMQLLADLSHPGIVQILDGGLGADQRPWLVLEYIDGQHLDEYCRSQSLDARQVVHLCRDLCDALQFIHLRGVVHMDIKPANVMVRNINGVAYPVLIDFGIALEAAGLGDEREGVVFGTRGYAAPEQLAGEVVDARADVWSMGMLMAQVFCRGQVDNIGVLAPADRLAMLRRCGVPQDLCDIVTRCTRERPARRYGSAESLRTDLDAWLNDLPVAASRHRPFHVIAKALRRHAVATVATLLVLLGAAWATWKYTADVSALQRVTQEEKNAGDALFNFMLGDLFGRLTRIGRIDVLQLVAERSIEHLGRQDLRALDDASRLQTATAYANAGRVFDELERSREALAAYSEARASLEPLAGKPGLEQEWLRLMAEILVLESRTHTTEGQRNETEASLLRARQMARDLVERYPDATHEPLWEAQLQLGWHYMEYDQPESALAALQGALATAEPAVAQTPDSRWLLNLSHSRQALAWHAYDYSEPGQASVEMARAIELARRATASGDDIEVFHNQRILLNQQAWFLTQEGRLDEAAQALEEAIALGHRLQAMAPANREYDRELAYSFSTGGETAERRGELQAALSLYRQGLDLSSRIAGQDAGGFSAANDHAVDMVNVANVLARLGDTREAQALWRDAVAMMEPVWRSEPDNKYYQYTLAVPLIQLGRYEEARPLIASIEAAGMVDEPFHDILVAHGLAAEDGTPES